MKKGLKDIQALKEMPCTIFGTQYNYIVELLFDWYIAKLDGEERIAAFLEDWDTEAKNYWINRLNERIEESYEDYEDTY